jgi:hypothetical protein
VKVFLQSRVKVNQHDDVTTSTSSKITVHDIDQAELAIFRWLHQREFPSEMHTLMPKQLNSDAQNS